MENVFVKNKILTGLITGGMLLSSFNTTFAATANPMTIDRKAPLTNVCIQISTKIQHNLETNSKYLVTGNTITQDQANKIKAVINRAGTAKKSNLDTSKTKTEQEKIYMASNKINYIDPLTTLVDNGTITQDQSEKIIMKQIYLCQFKRSHSLL